MYLMSMLGEEDRLVASQRYYNLVKSILEHSDSQRYYNLVKSILEHSDTNWYVKLTVVLGDVNLSWGHSTSGDASVMASFLLGEEEFDVDVSVYSNVQWEKWVETQPVRCVVYERDRLLTEFMEFVFDYYPDYEV